MSHATMNHSKMNMPPSPSSSSPMSMAGGMATYLHFGDDETVLFDFWKIDSWIGVIVSALVIIIICFIAEALNTITKSVECYKRDDDPQDPARSRRGPSTGLLRIVAGAVLHFLNLSSGYLLMLVVMTLNIWLCLAVVFGKVIARLFFAHCVNNKKMSLGASGLGK